MTRPVIHHWCQVLIIRGCGMVLNSTGCNRFTTTGHLRSYFNWPWTFPIARTTLHDCEVAPLTSQTLAPANFFTVCLTVVPFEFQPLTFTIGFHENKSIRSELMIFECSFPLKVCNRWQQRPTSPFHHEFKQLLWDVTIRSVTFTLAGCYRRTFKSDCAYLYFQDFSCASPRTPSSFSISNHFSISLRHHTILVTGVETNRSNIRK